jgi:hypothetical protein
MTPAQAAGLMGMVTVRSLPSGTFIAHALVTSRGALPDSARALVGLALKPGQVPVGGLAPGQAVLLVLLRPDQATGTIHETPLVTTTVWDLRGADSSGDVTATVVVPLHLAAYVSAYAAQGEVALVATARPPASTSPSPRPSAHQSPHVRPTPAKSSK